MRISLPRAEWSALTEQNPRFDSCGFVSSVGLVMQLTLKRKISFGLVGIGLIALVVDRLTSSDGPEPRPQPALHATDGSVVAHAAKPAAAETDLRLIELSAISAQLQTLASSQGLDPVNAQDAFHPASNWLAAPKAIIDTSAETSAAVTRFRQQHKLLAILKSGRAAMALIDGRTFRRGQTIDGFKIVEVHERSVIFDSGSAKVEIFVVGADPASASASDELLITPSRSDRGVQDP